MRWSPDGTQLAMLANFQSTNAADYEPYVMGAASGQTPSRVFAPGATSPAVNTQGLAWDPSSSQLSYRGVDLTRAPSGSMSPASLYIVPASTLSVTPAALIAAPDGGVIEGMSWNTP